MTYVTVVYFQPGGVATALADTMFAERTAPSILSAGLRYVIVFPTSVCVSLVKASFHLPVVYFTLMPCFFP